MPVSLAYQWVLMGVLVFAGCGEPELFVRVDPGNIGEREVDALLVRAFEPGQSPERARVELEDRLLPQSFLIRGGSRAAGDPVHVQIDALFEDHIVAMGDRIIPFPEGGRATTTITLDARCAGLACLGTRTCDATDKTCDFHCLSDEDCADYRGCSRAATCNLETKLCEGTADDADADGYGDARCEPGGGDDCDDGSNDAVPDGEPKCSFGRDYNCNGIVDEREGCESECAGQRVIDDDDSGFRQTVSIEAVGGIRVLSDGTRVLFSASLDAVRSEHEDGTNVSVVEATDVKQIFLHGNLLLAATDDGLLIIDIDNDGALRLIDVVEIVPGFPNQGLLSVTATQDTAWVSGKATRDSETRSIGLAAVDLSHRTSPRMLGWVEGSPAIGLASSSLGVLAVLQPVPEARAASIWRYDAVAGAAPMAGVSIAEDLELSEDLFATAVDAIPGETSTAPVRFAVGARALDVEASSSILLGEMSPMGVVPTDRLEGGLSGVTSVRLDRGTVTWVTQSGQIGGQSLSDGDEFTFSEAPGLSLSPGDHGLPAAMSASASLWTTTHFPSKDPTLLVGIDTYLWWVDFGCSDSF